MVEYGIYMSQVILWVFFIYAAIDYPWNDIDGKHRTALKKWLFLTDYPQILDKTILYGIKMHIH